jgi:hypothetical protein
MPSGLGGRELILIAAFVVLMVGVSRLKDLRPSRAPEGSRHGVDDIAARAYLDRLVGPARSRPHPGRPPLIQAVVRQETKR